MESGKTAPGKGHHGARHGHGRDGAIFARHQPAQGLQYGEREPLTGALFGPFACQQRRPECNCGVKRKGRYGGLEFALDATVEDLRMRIGAHGGHEEELLRAAILRSARRGQWIGEIDFPKRCLRSGRLDGRAEAAEHIIDRGPVERGKLREIDEMLAQPGVGSSARAPDQHVNRVAIRIGEQDIQEFRSNQAGRASDKGTAGHYRPLVLALVRATTRGGGSDFGLRAS